MDLDLCLWGSVMLEQETACTNNVPTKLESQNCPKCPGFPSLELSGHWGNSYKTKPIEYTAPLNAYRQVMLFWNSPSHDLSIRLQDREALFVNPLNMSPLFQSPMTKCFTTASNTQLSVWWCWCCMELVDHGNPCNEAPARLMPCYCGSKTLLFAIIVAHWLRNFTI